MDSDDSAAYDLVMPFLPVASRGGPYNDDAFAAGWQCGALCERLATAAAAGLPHYRETIRTELIGQVDLIAMQAGFVLTVEPSDYPEWSFATFHPPNDRQ